MTPDELNMAKTIVAANVEDIDVVNPAMYRETGKNDIDCRKYVADYEVKFDEMFSLDMFLTMMV